MSLSDWATLAFDTNANPSQGIIYSQHKTCCVEIYKNFLQIGHQPNLSAEIAWTQLYNGWNEDQFEDKEYFLDEKIEKENGHHTLIDGLSLTVRRHPQQAALFVYVKDNIQQQKMCGLSCATKERIEDWIKKKYPAEYAKLDAFEKKLKEQGLKEYKDYVIFAHYPPLAQRYPHLAPRIKQFTSAAAIEPTEPTQPPPQIKYTVQVYKNAKEMIIIDNPEQYPPYY